MTSRAREASKPGVCATTALWLLGAGLFSWYVGHLADYAVFYGSLGGVAIALGLAIAGLAALLVALPRLMPPGFLKFHRGLSQVIQTRGLLAGAFVYFRLFDPMREIEVGR